MRWPWSLLTGAGYGPLVTETNTAEVLVFAPIALTNSGPLELTPTMLAKGGTFTGSSITIEELGTQPLPIAGNLLLQATGSIVFLDTTNSISAAAGFTITIETGGVAALGNIATSNGEVKIVANGNVGIGTINAGTGTVSIASSGSIFNSNGGTLSIQAGQTLLAQAQIQVYGQGPSTAPSTANLAQLQLQAAQAFATADAASAQAAADQTTADAFKAELNSIAVTVSSDNLTYQNAVTATNAANSVVTNDQNTVNSDTKVINGLNLTAAVLWGVSAGFGLAASVATFNGAAALPVPVAGVITASAFFSSVGVLNAISSIANFAASILSVASASEAYTLYNDAQTLSKATGNLTQAQSAQDVAYARLLAGQDELTAVAAAYGVARQAAVSEAIIAQEDQAVAQADSALVLAASEASAQASAQTVAASVANATAQPLTVNGGPLTITGEAPSGSSVTNLTVSTPITLGNSISSIAANGSMWTVTTTAASGLAAGQPVTISGATQPAYDGTWTVASASTLTAPYSFTIASKVNPGPAGYGGAAAAVPAGVTLNGNGSAIIVSANITAPGPIVLQAQATPSGGGSLTVSSGATLQSSAPITLSAAGNSVAGGGATVTVAGTLNAPSATIYAGSATTPDQSNDTITITPSATTPITVVGGLGTDTLNINAAGLPVTLSGNTISVGTLKPVTFTNIHAVNITSEAGSSLTLDGTSGAANILSLVGTGQEAGTATLSGVAFTFSGMTSFSYQGGAGDTIAVTPFTNANVPWKLAVTVAGGTGSPANLTYYAAGPYDTVTATANAAGAVAEPGVATVHFANVAQVIVNYLGIPNVVQVPNLTLADAGGIYNGMAFPATAQVNGAASTAPTLTYYGGTLINAATQLSRAPINVGCYTVVATLAANGTYVSASAVTTFIIAPATPTVSVNPVKLIYGTALANSQLSGTATFTANGTTISVPGTFSYTSAAGTVLAASATAYTEAVTFTPKSTIYATPTQLSVLVTVGASATTTALTSSLNLSGLGQTVTFTAKVTAMASGSGTPTGTVTFKSGTTTLAAAVPLSSGVATFSTSGLALGRYTITAVYSSDTGNYSTSTSAAVSQVVVAKTSSTGVTTSLTPSPFGQKVTFKATVTGPGGTPAGKVTFKDGATVLATVTLSAGTASLSTVLLTTGTHSITAVYSGNATFGSSTSTVLTQTINAAATAKLLRRRAGR